MTISRTNFKQAFRRRLDPNASPISSHIVSDPQIDGFLDDALGLYSNLKPNRGQRAQVSATPGSPYIELPLDFMSDSPENTPQLEALEQNRDPLVPRGTYSSLNFRQGNTYNSWGGLNQGGYNSYSGYGSPFNGINDNVAQPLTPPAIPVGSPRPHTKVINGVKTPVLTLRYILNSERKYTLLYVGRHMIADAYAIITIISNPIPGDPLIVLPSVGVEIDFTFENVQTNDSQIPIGGNVGSTALAIQTALDEIGYTCTVYNNVIHVLGSRNISLTGQDGEAFTITTNGVRVKTVNYPAINTIPLEHEHHVFNLLKGYSIINKKLDLPEFQESTRSLRGLSAVEYGQKIIDDVKGSLTPRAWNL